MCLLLGVKLSYFKDLVNFNKVTRIQAADPDLSLYP